MKIDVYKHKHSYVYEYELQQKMPFSGSLKEHYVLLTDTDNPRSKTNMLYLESALRVAYGYYPKNVKFKYEKSI